MRADIEAAFLGNIEAIDQGLVLLSGLTPEQYQYIAFPYVESSIGQHIRHIADIYSALLAGLDSTVVNYDVRRRGASVESMLEVAQDELQSFRDSFAGLLDVAKESDDFTIFTNSRLSVKSEVQLSEQQFICIHSSFLRECVFAASHAVHHYALINVIAKLQNIEMQKDLGVAPATASFLRSSRREIENGKLIGAPHVESLTR